jgi:hypothetical protein
MLCLGLFGLETCQTAEYTWEDVVDFRRPNDPDSCGNGTLSALPQVYIPTYISFEFWKGSRTTPGAYLTHWGLFLFAVMAWMILESRDWMANTPLSALRVFRPYTQILWIAVLSVFLVVTVLVWIGVSIAWFVLPLLAWAALLMLNPAPRHKTIFTALVITALCMTLMVEIVTLAGDVAA